MRKGVAITADDYGPHPYINAGILEAVHNNAIDSVGVLPNNYTSKDGKHKYNLEAELDKLVHAIGDKKIGIGLHLSISSGEPLTNNKRLLLEDGHFQNLSTFDFALLRGGRQAIYDELKAQIVRFQKAMAKYGLPMDHISSHHSLITSYTPYNDILVRLVKEMKLKTTVRNPLPISKQGRRYRNFRKSAMKKEATGRALRLADDNLLHIIILLKGIKRKSFIKKRKQFLAVGCKVPHHFFDNYYMKPNAHELNRIFRKFHKRVFGATGEVVVHLGKGDHAEVEFHGINNGYFPIRLKELEELNKYDFSYLDTENRVERRAMLRL